jgi:hypothetical protein
MGRHSASVCDFRSAADKISPNPFEFTPGPFANGVARATWQDSWDTSSVWAKAIATATVSPDSIAWVLLEAAGVQVGPGGGRTLAVTTFVQRLNTFTGRGL